MNTDKLATLKKLNPRVGTSIRKTFRKKKTERFEDMIAKAKENLSLTEISEISRIHFYFKDCCWRLDNRSTICGSIKNKCFLVTVSKKEIVQEKQVECESETLDKEQTDSNKYLRWSRDYFGQFSLKRLEHCRIEFYKGSTQMVFSGGLIPSDNKAVDVYSTIDPNVFVVFADIEVKKSVKEEVNYSDVLEKLKKGQLKANFSNGESEVIKESIKSDIDLDKLIDDDIDQILDLREKLI